MNEEKPQTIFFFGAGASKPADVGTTIELVGEFRKYLDNKKDKDLIGLLNEVLAHLNKTDLDIEDLMTALERLSSREKDPLLKFYDENSLKLTKNSVIPKLQEKLKEFIQETTAVKENKVGYLNPLLSFDKPRIIFSVNYDTLIEQFCNVNKLRYTDGFEYEWNPKLFEDKEKSFDFHLYKIHGSIMWYKTDKNNYVKLAIPPKGKQELIFGEQAIPLMLYPMQKWEFVEPLLEMLLQLKKFLVDVNFVVVVGYSFRDPHIVRLFHEAARRNQKLIVVLIGPSARQQYEDKLKFHTDDNGVPTGFFSMLNGRVLCLQYKFQDIVIRVKEIMLHCQGALALEDGFQQSKRMGYPQDPTELLSRLADVEFLDLADKISKDVPWSEHFTLTHVNSSLMLSCFKLFVTAEIQGQRESADYWLYRFLTSFNLIQMYFPAKITAMESIINFPTYDTLVGYGGAQSHISNLLLFIANQRKLRGEKFSSTTKDLCEKVELWIRHTNDLLLGGSIGYTGYLVKIRDFSATWLNNQLPRSVDTLQKMLDEDFRIRDYNTNRIPALDAIISIESDVMNSTYGEQGNLLKYMITNHKDRVSNPDQPK